MLSINFSSESVFRCPHLAYAHFGIESGKSGKKFLIFFGARRGPALTGFIDSVLLVRLMKLW